MFLKWARLIFSNYYVTAVSTQAKVAAPKSYYHLLRFGIIDCLALPDLFPLRLIGCGESIKDLFFNPSFFGVQF